MKDKSKTDRFVIKFLINYSQQILSTWKVEADSIKRLQGLYHMSYVKEKRKIDGRDFVSEFVYEKHTKAWGT